MNVPMMSVRAADATQDTSAVAYVTKPAGPPDNSSFMNGAYAVAIAIYVGYIVLMMRRMSHARRVAEARRNAPRRDR